MNTRRFGSSFKNRAIRRGHKIDEGFKKLGYTKESYIEGSNVIRYKHTFRNAMYVIAFHTRLKIWRHYKVEQGVYTAWGTSYEMHKLIEKLFELYKKDGVTK